MTAQDRARWDEVYRTRDSQPFPAPAPLLLEYTPMVKPGYECRALDLAGGVGQNGLWLAAQGYTVDVMDISRVALMRGKNEMEVRGLRSLNFLQVDLDEVEIEAERYHLVCVFRYLKRELFPQLRASICPGGRIIYETFNTRYRSLVPDFNPSFLLEPGELALYFAGWNVVFSGEDQHISRLVALKP
jgi:tellurite methyltransferase